MNHFDVLKKVIAEHDGAIAKTIGDAVMAVFRCPANALVAMLDAQSALANPGEGGMPLQLKSWLAQWTVHRGDSERPAGLFWLDRKHGRET